MPVTDEMVRLAMDGFLRAQGDTRDQLSAALTAVYPAIRAEVLREAREKARRGEYEEWDVECADAVNWTLRPDSVEPNE